MRLLQDKNHTGILILVCLAIFFVNLDVIYVNIMEARNFITAREMVTDGNWLLTTMNGLPRYEKPPLPTWMAALSGMLFGFKSLAALRVPSALITLLMVLYMYRFSVTLLKDKQQALINSLVLSSSFYVVFAGRNGTWDIFAHSFMLVGIYYLFLFFTYNDRLWRNAMVSGVFLGLSFMSKGPVSHFALLLPFLISYGIVYKYSGFNKKWLPLFVLLVITAVLSSWWGYYVYVMDADTVLAIAEKESTAWAERNVRPFYYYWSFFTQSGIWTIPAFISLLYPYLKTRVSNLKVYRLSFLWTISAVLLLSVIPEKKSRYLLPVLIPLALNMGFYIEYLFCRFGVLKDKRETLPVYINFGLIALIGLIFPFGGYLFLGEKLSGFYFWYVLVSIALFIVAVYMVRFLLKKQIDKVFYLTIVFIMAVMSFGYPLANSFLNNPDFNPPSQLAMEVNSSGLKIYGYGSLSPEIVWDFGQKIPLVDVSGPALSDKTPFMVLTSIGGHEKLKAALNEHTITSKGILDLNMVNNSKRGYKDRLRAEIYLVSKK